MKASPCIRTLIAAGLIALLSACARSSDPQEPDGPDAAAVLRSGVEYSADTRVMESFPVQLATTVTATNTSDRNIDLTFPDGCVVLLRAYHDADRTRLAWDQAEHVGCTMALVSWRIDAGAAREANAHTNAADILGAALPDGRYWLEAVLRPDGRTIRVPAGSVDLAVPRD
jgi:hypothetical protein